MLIAITAIGKDLNSAIDCRFGRAKYIIIFDTEKSTFVTNDNKLNLNAKQGAGIQTAQNIIDFNAEAVITGNCGPKAFKVLDSGSVKIYTASNSTVGDAIIAFNDKKLQELTNPNVQGHWS